MIPKEIKYNLHYDDVRGDVLWPPHDTTPATVEKRKKVEKVNVINQHLVCLFLAAVAALILLCMFINAFIRLI